jgi:hypothetical protein
MDGNSGSLLVIEHIEYNLEPRDNEQLPDSRGRPKEVDIPVAGTDGRPKRYQLSQTGTVDVIDSRDVEDKETISLPQQFLNPVLKRQVLDPEPAGHIQNHDVIDYSRADFECHGSLS